jgi:hypothetical protein
MTLYRNVTGTTPLKPTNQPTYLFANKGEFFSIYNVGYPSRLERLPAAAATARGYDMMEREKGDRWPGMTGIASLLLPLIYGDVFIGSPLAAAVVGSAPAVVAK